MKKYGFLIILIATTVLVVSGAIAQPSTITWIEPGAFPFGVPMAIINDGSTFAGQDYFSGNSFIWTAEDGFTTLPASLVYDIADNGMIVGEKYLPHPNYPDDVKQAAYYDGQTWTALDGFDVIPTDPDWYTHCYSIARETGDKIVGMAWIDAGHVVAYEWTFDNGWTTLESGDQDGQSYKAMYQSGDGSIVAGWDELPNGCRTGYKWTPDPTSLGTLSTDPTWPHAEPAYVSDNGMYIVGSSWEAISSSAFRYTEDGGMVSLGLLPGHTYMAYGTAVTDDGVVFGWSQADFWGVREPVIWTEQDGMYPFADYLALLGLELPEGYSIDYIADTSNDGRYILGSALDANWNSHWFIVEVNNGSPDPVTLTLTPANTIIPANGGTLTYSAHLLSTLAMQYNNVQYWTEIVIPNNQTYGPLQSFGFDLVPFMDATVNNLTQNVPAIAPAGEYTFKGHVGYPNGPAIMDSFTFSKEASASASDGFGINDWNAGGSWITGDDVEMVDLPRSFELVSVYPNPFNPATEITLALPEASDLSLCIANILGQEVATIASGRYIAGTHNFTFDGSTLASGIYFLHATVQGKLDVVRKVTLMK